ncbi:tetratricopeptide repeat protein [Pseudoalteromonas rhizosphaerae]|nr:tetratricopeptide repeat protein [Pseudoalteromonas rhizosphaerae]
MKFSHAIINIAIFSDNISDRRFGVLKNHQNGTNRLLRFRMSIEDINKKAKSLIDETWKDNSKWHQNFDEAKSILEQVLHNHTDDELTLINYGTVLCDMGKHQEAAEYFKKAIDQGSNNKHAFYNLGVALMNCSTDENAMFYMKKAKSKQACALTWVAYFDPMGH